ncbi:FCD domain-containing protein [Xanthobacter autotrophicus]|uniref:FCD domain-containing protein n=1 Tax=Xanthobacter autotrophicus TaxID=280 RepID=UPI003728B087
MDQNLREQVLRHVRSEIISGQSGPGKMYSVPTLAADLGMSTTPGARGAAGAGAHRPHRTHAQPRLQGGRADRGRSAQPVRDAKSAGGASGRAVRAEVAQKKKTLEHLTGLADAVRAAVEEDDLYGYLESDRNFHLAFISAAENSLLTEMAMGQRDKMRLHGISSRSGMERQVSSVAEHYRLVRLAESGDVEGIKALMTSHILTWEPIFIEALLKSRREVGAALA